MRRFPFSVACGLALIVLLALCLSGCNDRSGDDVGVIGENSGIGEEDATGPVIVDEAGATGPVICLSADALQHVGETVTVIGEVVAVADGDPDSGQYVITLDSEESGEGFTVVLSFENASELDLHGLLGTIFGVTGKIYENTSQQKGAIEVTDRLSLFYLVRLGSDYMPPPDTTPPVTDRTP